MKAVGPSGAGDPAPADGIGETALRPRSTIAAGDADATNTLQTYLREIRRAPLFTPEQEYDTAMRARGR